MSFRVRPARNDDFQAIYEMAKLTGGGFTNLPADKGALVDKLVRRCGAELGQTIAWQPSGGVCDGNNIAACGVPVVDTMGVRGGAIHSAEEYMIVDSLAEGAQLSALVMMRLAAGDAR